MSFFKIGYATDIYYRDVETDPEDSIAKLDAAKVTQEEFKIFDNLLYMMLLEKC